MICQVVITTLGILKDIFFLMRGPPHILAVITTFIVGTLMLASFLSIYEAVHLLGASIELQNTPIMRKLDYLRSKLAHVFFLVFVPVSMIVIPLVYLFLKDIYSLDTYRSFMLMYCTWFAIAQALIIVGLMYALYLGQKTVDEINQIFQDKRDYGIQTFASTLTAPSSMTSTEARTSLRNGRDVVVKSAIETHLNVGLSAMRVMIAITGGCMFITAVMAIWYDSLATNPWLSILCYIQYEMLGPFISLVTLAIAGLAYLKVEWAVSIISKASIRSLKQTKQNVELQPQPRRTATYNDSVL
jgi:hypothetical protein